MVIIVTVDESWEIKGRCASAVMVGVKINLH